MSRTRLLGGIGLLAALFSGDQAPQDRALPIPLPRADPSGAPCLAGRAATLEDARGELPFPMMLPEHPLAERRTVSALWLCGTDAAVVTFHSGITLRLRLNDEPDPAGRWRAMSEQEPVAQLAVVRGQEALLIPPVPERNGPGGLQFVEGVMHIGMSGNGQIPLAELIAVAESLRPV